MPPFHLSTSTPAAALLLVLSAAVVLVSTDLLLTTARAWTISRQQQQQQQQRRSRYHRRCCRRRGGSTSLLRPSPLVPSSTNDPRSAASEDAVVRLLLSSSSSSSSHEATTTTTTTTTASAAGAASDSTTSPQPEIILYNSKTRSKQPFVTVASTKIKKGGGGGSEAKNAVSMYTCGPTVYDSAHVGNFRAFLTYDVLKRVLAYFGYDVTHVCNLTDVDDKIIKRANEKQLERVTDLTREYERSFLQDLHLLNAVPATHYPRATEHIDEMMDMISILAKKGLAYETPDGSWYFRTQAQPGYGTQLVGGLDYDEMEQQEDRQQQGEDDDDGVDGTVIRKEHFADFCLWKAYKDGVDRMDAAWENRESDPPIRLGRYVYRYFWKKATASVRTCDLTGHLVFYFRTLAV